MSLAALAVVSGGLRFWDLGVWPAFVDEDMNTTVAAQMTALPWPAFILHSTDFEQTGISKAPLLFAVHAGFIAAGQDPLIAGRILSACAGVAATLLAVWLGWRIGGRAVGVATGALYAVLPVAVLHERLAVQDGPMSAAALAAVLVFDRAVARRSAGLFLLGGALGCLAVQFKVSGVLSALILLRVALVNWRELDWPLRIAALTGVSLVGLSYEALMLAPTGGGLAAQNALLVGLTPETLVHNLATLADTIGTYFPAGLWLAIPVGYYVMARQAQRFAPVVLWALVANIIPWIVLSSFAPSRYFLPLMPYLCALLGLGLVSACRVVAARLRLRDVAVAVGPALAVLVLLQPSARLTTSPELATLSELDDWQYRSGWPAGFSYAAAAHYVAAALPPAARVALIIDHQHRVAAGINPVPTSDPRYLGPLLLQPETRPLLDASAYVVIDDTRYFAAGERLHTLRLIDPALHEVASFANPGSGYWVRVLAH